MTTFTIAVLPGDGIGPDVIAEGVKVLRAVERCLDQVRFELPEFSMGAGEFLKSGNPLPPATLDRCRSCDAILLGAMGLPDVRWPSGVEMTPQIDLREHFDLYCGLRRSVSIIRTTRRSKQSVLAASISSSFAKAPRDYSPRHAPAVAADASVATDTMRITRAGAERVCRSAFEWAVQRRQLCTLVDKANVLPSMAYFRRIFDEVAKDFPTVKTERTYVDAAALYLLRRPHTFDVIVTENMFGDILSDLAAGLIGGMGMAPSGDIGPKHAVFQPSHGTAPDIAGKGIANPIAMILSAALMLEWLNKPQTLRGAEMIRSAVEKVLSDPTNRTPDLGGKLTTSEVGDRIAAEIK